MSTLFIDDGEQASGRKVMLATPVYDKPSACYTYSLSTSRQALHNAGIGSAYLLLTGNCHVDDARNTIVQEFLLSDCTDLVFLDADVSWDAADLVKLCQYDVDLVAGIYPFRRETTRSSSSMPIIMYPDKEPVDGLLEVAGLPTGFMKIRRGVLEELSKGADHFWKKTDRRAKIPILFERTYFDGRRLGGDLSFCKKWVAHGGTMYADTEMRLGHAVSGGITYDSLGAFLRRTDDTTLRHMVERIRSSQFDPEALMEARKSIDNDGFAAPLDVLSICAIMAKQARGPILETGSGLSTVVMAAVSKHPVYALESSPGWGSMTETMLEKAGVEATVVSCPMKDGWYDVPDSLPGEFALALNDGPTRSQGDRMTLFDRYGSTEGIICDDADDVFFAQQLEGWCASHSRRIDFFDRAAIIR